MNFQKKNILWGMKSKRHGLLWHRMNCVWTFLKSCHVHWLRTCQRFRGWPIFWSFPMLMFETQYQMPLVLYESSLHCTFLYTQSNMCTWWIWSPHYLPHFMPTQFRLDFLNYIDYDYICRVYMINLILTRFRMELVHCTYVILYTHYYLLFIFYYICQ